MTKKTIPGVSRDQRISDEGLARLEKHLKMGTKISEPILRKWVERYGDEARNLLKRHGFLVNE